MLDSGAGFAAWLKARRKARDLTQQDLAQAVGCSVKTIQKLEAGERRPSRQIAELLADHLGITTDARAAFVQFARGTGPLSPGMLEEVSVPLPPHNLPAPPTTFFGRIPELALAQESLARPGVRLLTLVGAPGIGKTRLGIQIARSMLPQFPDGVWFVPLGRLGNPDLLVAALGQTLHVREAAGQTLRERLLAHLRDKRLLLVLDDFDPVLVAAPLVADLLVTAPDVKILVTSRTLLHLYGEHELHTPPLSLPPAGPAALADDVQQYEAVALLIERANAAQPGFQLTADNAQAVVDICRQLEGIPLAIELAAARLKFLAPAVLRDRLASRLQFLVGGPSNLPMRQQTLRGAIEWSYHLLDAPAQQLFRAFAVFDGSCSVEAGQAVLGATEDDLLGLADKSLIYQEPTGPTAGNEVRFAMLETIREYARERHQASQEAGAIWRNYVKYFGGLAAAAEHALWGAEQRPWMERLEREHDNLRAVLRGTLAAGDLSTAARVAGALWRFWEQRGYWSEGRRWLDAILAYQNALPLAERAKLLDGAGLLAAHQGDYTPAVALLEESLILYRRLGNRAGLADALSSLQMVAMSQGDYEHLTAWASESLALYHGLGNQVGIARSLRRMGIAALAREEHAQATTFFEESLSLDRALGNTAGVASALGSLGEVARCQGDYTRAARLYEESLDLYRELGQKVNIANLLQNLGYVAHHQGAYTRAAELFHESLLLCAELGDRRSIAGCLEGLAGVAGNAGAPERAARLFGAASALHEAIGARLHRADLAEYTENVSRVRDQLNPQAFAAAWAAGRGLTLDQVLVYAADPMVGS